VRRSSWPERFITKWIGDIAESQENSGQLPLIVPSGGWGRKELSPAPEWTTVYPFLLREMYRVYGDDRLAARHWPTLVRYLDWEIGRLRDGLATTVLGDYHAPGTGGVPPEDTRLTASAYLYRGLVLACELGDLLGRDVSRYREVAAGLKNTVNATFLDPAGCHRGRVVGTARVHVGTRPDRRCVVGGGRPNAAHRGGARRRHSRGARTRRTAPTHGPPCPLDVLMWR